MCGCLCVCVFVCVCMHLEQSLGTRFCALQILLLFSSVFILILILILIVHSVLHVVMASEHRTANHDTAVDLQLSFQYGQPH